MGIHFNDTGGLFLKFIYDRVEGVIFDVFFDQECAALDPVGFIDKIVDGYFEKLADFFEMLFGGEIIPSDPARHSGRNNSYRFS